jgi:outer membrane protein assembly factor BamD (BamD/ComL family)
MNSKRGRTAVYLAIGVAAALAAALSGCVSTQLPPDANELPARKLVQLAQEAADKSNYALAIQYYQVVRDRADDVERSLWAAYEIAFLHHKMGDDETAIALFDELIRDYEERNDPELPQGPRILAQKVRDRLSSP